MNLKALFYTVVIIVGFLGIITGAIALIIEYPMIFWRGLFILSLIWLGIGLYEIIKKRLERGENIW